MSEAIYLLLDLVATERTILQQALALDPAYRHSVAFGLPLNEEIAFPVFFGNLVSFARSAARRAAL
jgi:hypothetical protein